MKSPYDVEKIAKHIRRVNELMGVDGTLYDNHNCTITTDLLKALKGLEYGPQSRGHVFTTNAVDRAVDDMKGEEW